MSPPALPIRRITWQLRDILALLLEDPSREVWLYSVDKALGYRNSNRPNLIRLAAHGWITVREEGAACGGASRRRVYRLTPEGEALARETLARYAIPETAGPEQPE